MPRVASERACELSRSGAVMGRDPGSLAGSARVGKVKNNDPSLTELIAGAG
jgi:hypothetical protein